MIDFQRVVSYSRHVQYTGIRKISRYKKWQYYVPWAC